MSRNIIFARVQQKTDTLPNWNANNLVPLPGEPCFVVDNNGAGINFKIGDGVRLFRDLPWFNIILVGQGEYVIVVDNIASMRALPTTIIDELVNQNLKGIQVLGYYVKGDTPNPITYYVSETESDDDGGSVIDINGVKFEHKFINAVECKYYGIFNSTYNPEDINKIISYCYNNGVKDIVLSSDISLTIPSTYDGIGISMQSNINFHLRGTVTVTPNNNDRYRVFNLSSISNCAIIGYPTGGIIGDVETHTGTTGEWGHGVYIGDNCSNITIQDLNVTKCWGDGVYVGGFQSDDNYSTDINIVNSNLTTNRRQGISIAKGKNITINGNVIKDTGVIRGTFPMDGIDIEPNVNNKVNNVKIFNNSFINNKGYDFQIYCNTNNSKVTNVSFYDNDIENSQPKFNSTINTLVSISGRRLDTSVFPSHIIIRNNTFYVSDLTHLNSVVYNYGSTNDLTIVNNNINSTNYLNTFRFDTVNNVKINNNTHDNPNNFITLLTACDGFIIQNNKLNTVQNAFLVASSSTNIDLFDNIVSNQINSGDRVISCANINGMRIINNNFSNIRRGIFICTSTINNFIFKLNTVLEYNTSSTANEPMLYITAATARSTNNVISNNTIIQNNNTVSYGIRVSSVSPNTMTNTIIKDNELIGTYSVRISNEVGALVLVSDKNIILDSTNETSGLVRRSSFVNNAVSPNATDLATALILVNELKAQLNAKLTADRNSGQQQIT